MKRSILIVCGTILVIIVAVILLLHHTTHHSIHATKDSHTVTAMTPDVSLVSLGDSVAAGDGLPENNTAQASLCNQSLEAYPYLVAESLHMSIHQFACSGAETSAGILGVQEIGTQTVTPQLQEAKPYIPGNDVVITIGANDVGWSSFLTSCAESDCASAANLALFQGRLTNLQSQLSTLLQDIAALHPHLVVLNTYYSIVSSSDTCQQQYGITTSKITWVNARETSLNETIVSAAQKYHDKYALVTFNGHDICSPDPWIQSLSSAAPLHPTSDGQSNIATLDEAELR